MRRRRSWFGLLLVGALGAGYYWWRRKPAKALAGPNDAAAAAALTSRPRSPLTLGILAPLGTIAVVAVAFAALGAISGRDLDRSLSGGGS